jgi:hypothetical protein
MITVECFNCGRVLEVPTPSAQMYIMLNQIPCRYCVGEEE